MNKYMERRNLYILTYTVYAVIFPGLNINIFGSKLQVIFNFWSHN